MNLYEKINKIKEGILKANLKKSGYNKFSNFNYYELADITPTIIKLCNEYHVMTQFTFDKEYASLRIWNIEDPTEHLTYCSPMKDLTIKGANEIQALGGTETYQRRYLYMMAFDIIESDMFDATSGRTDEDLANAYKFKSGVFKDLTIKEAYNKDKAHLQKLLDIGRIEEVKGYIELLTDLKRTPIPSDEEQHEIFEYLNKIKMMSDEQREKIYKKYKVKSNQELTLEQMREIFKIIYLNKFNAMSEEQQQEIFEKYKITSSKDLTLQQLREIFI